MSNTSFWGPAAWNFFHQIPWLFPTEILETQDAVVVIRFCHSLPKILPCIWCSESAQDFEKQIGLISSFTYDINGVKIVTRSNLAKYFYDLHNRVNQKLGYPTMKGTWRDSVKSRKDWVESMFLFLFACCWNVSEQDSPPEDVSTLYTFFTLLLPKVLKYTDVGKAYAKYLDQNPLTKKIVSKRHLISKWIYEAKVACLPQINHWDYLTTDLYVESFRAKVTNCHPDKKEELDKTVKGCF